MPHCSRVGFLFLLFIFVGTLVSPAAAQSQDESLRIYTEHPRLFLGQHRLKLLQKEKERRSLRLQQFELLMAGPAPPPPTGFLNALYFPGAGGQPSGPAGGGLGVGGGGKGPRGRFLL